MLVLRKILFYLFLLAYLTFCPLLILYAFGYIFNPKNLKLVQTGLVSLSSIPAQATVYIGKSHYKEKTPVVIRELIPGNYSLRVYLKDYEPWNRDVHIEAGKTLVFENILLIPKHWNVKGLSPWDFRELAPIPETNLLLLSKGQKVKDYYVYERKEEKIWPLIGADSVLSNAKVLSRCIIKGSPGFLLYLDMHGKKKHIWIEPKEKKAKVKDITDLFPQEPLHIEWDANDSRYMFSQEKEYLNRIDAVSSAIFPRYIEGLRGFGVYDKLLYILKNDFTLQRSNYDKTNNEDVFINDALRESLLLDPKGFLGIKVFEKNIFVFSGKRGEIFINYLSYAFTDKGVLGFKFDKGSKKLLFWKKDKIGILDFSDIEEDGLTLSKNPALRWVYTKADDIIDCAWVLRASHIIFQDKAGAYLLELENDGGGRLNFITGIKRDSSIVYAEDAGILYYLEAETGRLASLELIPRSHLSLILFPEKLQADGNEE